MPSHKTAIIQYIFENRWTHEGLSNPIVTLEDVRTAIVEYNQVVGREALSARNPANFFKDFIRNIGRANEAWPKAVLNRGYTARQLTGQGNCFEFVPLEAGQAKPFPSLIDALSFSDSEPYLIESVSLPPTARVLGRSDETWLIQVIVKLNVIPTHLALYSKLDLLHVSHLQTGVKLRTAEIDALFLAERGTEPTPERVIVTCEAKTGRDDILDKQIINQAREVLSMKKLGVEKVIPMAVKAIGPSRLLVIEFEPVEREGAEDLISLVPATHAVYQLKPNLKGIS